METMKGKAPAMVKNLIQRTDLPFSLEVMSFPLPKKFKIPQIEAFDDTKNLLSHLKTYKILIHLQVAPDEIMFKAFLATLKGSTRTWLDKLKPRSISTFTELNKQFMNHFIGSRRYNKPTTYLLNVKQNKGESLRDYVIRFNSEVLQVDEANKKGV